MMKTVITTIALSCLFFGAEAQQTIDFPSDTKTDVVEQPATEAQFPGGTAALMKFLSDSLKYPESAVKDNVGGTVYAQFIVQEDGSVTQIVIARGIKDHPEFDKEVIRVLKTSPKWIPAKDVNGKPMKSKYTLPVKFSPK